jgi:DNA-binding CsgD family transcriptional regulator/PAS domain-containing protein
MAVLQPLRETDEVITQIYEGPLEPQPWKSFLRGLRRRMDCDVAAMSLRPANTGLRPLTIWDRSEPLTPQQARQATDDHARLAHLDPLGNALRRSGDIFILDELIARDALVETERYRTLMKPYGVEYQMGMYFAEPNGWGCQIGLMNGPAKSNFTEEHKQFFVAFLPHLERALRLYALLKRNEVEKAIYEEALDRLTIGTIILDGRGHVIESNRAALQLLEQSACVSVLDGQVTPARAAHRAELHRLIDEARAWRERGHEETFVDAMRIDCPSGSRLGLLIRAAPASDWYRSSSSPSVIIYVLGDLERTQLAPEHVVAELFGLTESEALLATLLANGYTLGEAAAKLGLTESSVRTYSKKIFSKTGAKRQAELVRLILKTVSLLGGLHPPLRER